MKAFFKKWFAPIKFKRLFDIVVSFLALVILSPLFLVICVINFFTPDTSVFFSHERRGRKGKPFKIYKFQTMKNNTPNCATGELENPEQYITKFGRFLRKTKMDELANLFNIIRGEMSFVGPRPELLRYTKLYSGEEEYILKVRPGITDFSSCTFINLDEIVGSENADEMYEKYVLKNKNALRVKYAAEVSFKTDVKIFFKTLFGVAQKFFFTVSGKN